MVSATAQGDGSRKNEAQPGLRQRWFNLSLAPPWRAHKKDSIEGKSLNFKKAKKERKKEKKGRKKDDSYFSVMFFSLSFSSK